jgi:hypothetical protein
VVKGTLSRGIPINYRGIDPKMIKFELTTVGQVRATGHLRRINHQLTLVKVSEVAGKSILK